MTEQPTGISLYRFEPPKDERFEQLEKNQLYISNPKTFNDPCDLQLRIKDRTNRLYKTDDHFKKIIEFIYKEKLINDFYILDDEIKEELQAYCEGNIFSDLDALAKACSKRILTFGVQCFSLDFNIPLNWAHYGHAHTGFCIEYNFRPLDLAFANERLLDAYHVSYTNKLPEVCISEILLTSQQAMQKLLATKTLEWAYEQEIRLIHYEKQRTLINMPNGLAIKSLIAGANMSSEHIEKLKNIGDELNMPVYQMQRNHDCEFELPWTRKLISNLD